MDERRVSVTSKVIEAAVFFGHILGPPVFRDATAGFQWEWYGDHEDDDEPTDCDLDHLRGIWVVLSISDLGQARAMILCCLTDRSTQYTLAGYCAVHGIPYTIEFAPEDSPTGDEDPKIMRLVDHRKRRARHP